MVYLCRLSERFYRNLALSLLVLLCFVVASRTDSSNPHPLEEPLQVLLLLMEALGDWRAAGPCNRKDGKKRRPSKQTTSFPKTSPPPGLQNNDETPQPVLFRQDSTKAPLAHSSSDKKPFFRPSFPYGLWIQSQKAPYLPSLLFKIRAAGLPCLAVNGPEGLQAFINDVLKTQSMPRPSALLLYRLSEQFLLQVLQKKEVLAPEAPLFVVVDPEQWNHQYGREARDLLRQEHGARVILLGKAYSYRPCRVIQQLRRYIKPTDQEWYEHKILELGLYIRISFQKKAIRWHQQEIVLSEMELRVFMYLLEHHGRLVTYEQMARDIWEDPADAQYTGRLHTYISNLRKALGVDAKHPCLQTVRKRGYILNLKALDPVFMMPCAAFYEGS